MVQQTPATEVASWLAEGASFEFIDVRTPWEFEMAAVDGAQLTVFEQGLEIFESEALIPETGGVEIRCGEPEPESEAPDQE